MSAEPLKLEGLSFAYGELPVIHWLDVEIAAGEFVALVGPSGCGKSTLLELIAGHQRPTSGQVRCRGVIRTITQADGLFPWMTVRENIGLGLRRLDAKSGSAQIDAWLELTGMMEFASLYPHQISGGMRQRVELARILAGNADVLLMDEPFSALDYQARLSMREELVRVLALQPRTVLLVTHDIPEAVQLADRVFVLSERPTRICRSIQLETPRPRDLTSPEVIDALGNIHAEIGKTRSAIGVA
jgi:NitT/TauT family transport system ATP-binding protein